MVFLGSLDSYRCRNLVRLSWVSMEQSYSVNALEVDAVECILYLASKLIQTKVWCIASAS